MHTQCAFSGTVEQMHPVFNSLLICFTFQQEPWIFVNRNPGETWTGNLENSQRNSCEQSASCWSERLCRGVERVMISPSSFCRMHKICGLEVVARISPLKSFSQDISFLTFASLERGVSSPDFLARRGVFLTTPSPLSPAFALSPVSSVWGPSSFLLDEVYMKIIDFQGC